MPALFALGFGCACPIYEERELWGAETVAPSTLVLIAYSFVPTGGTIIGFGLTGNLIVTGILVGEIGVPPPDSRLSHPLVLVFTAEGSTLRPRSSVRSVGEQSEFTGVESGRYHRTTLAEQVHEVYERQRNGGQPSKYTSSDDGFR
jgi:hypothetical protein